MTPDDPIDVDADYTEEEILDQDGGDVVYDDADEIYDENWDETDEPVAAAPVKKKGGLFNILLIGGAVLIGGGIMVMHFTPKKQPAGDLGAPNAEITSSQPLTPIAADDSAAPPANNELSGLKKDVPDENILPAATQPAMPSTPTQQGFMDNPSKLDATTAQKTPTTPAPSLPDQGPSMTGLDAPAPSGTPAVPQNLPSIDQIKKAAPAPVVAEKLPLSTPAPITPAPVITPITKTPPVVAAIPSTQPSAHEVELQSKIDDMAKKVTELEKKLSEKPVVAPAPVADATEVADLKASVAKLEDKIASMKQSTAKTETSNVETQEIDPAPKHIAKKSSPPKKRKVLENSDDAYSPPTVSSNWQLRGARTGEAMIGKEGQAEFKTVHVGDVVAGLGQILSISQVGGSWVVQGNAGKISQ